MLWYPVVTSPEKRKSGCSSCLHYSSLKCLNEFAGKTSIAGLTLVNTSIHITTLAVFWALAVLVAQSDLGLFIFLKRIT